MTYTVTHQGAQACPVRHRLFIVWMYPVQFAEASEWMTTLDKETAHWSWIEGRSYINGKEYPNSVIFEDDEDFLVFKLRWPELLLK